MGCGRDITLKMWPHPKPGSATLPWYRIFTTSAEICFRSRPNAAHYALASLEEKYDVTIITQNIDDLHERAGSTKVVHLHGIITRSQSSIKASLTYPIDGWEIKMGETCELGSQLRPMWFGLARPYR
jgi:NAD-dependent SIR2 family protein deacetylase